MQEIHNQLVYILHNKSLTTYVLNIQGKDSNMTWVKSTVI